LIDPLIGDRSVPFRRSAVPLASIVNGILREERAFLGGDVDYAHWQQLRAQWVSKDIPDQGSSFWKCHLSAKLMEERLTKAWNTGDDSALFREAVFLYTTESFLYRALNSACRNRDTTKAHLAPFLKLLHGGLQSFPLDYRYTGPVYRTVRLNDELKSQYTPHRNDETLNFFSYDGFTSGTMSAARSLQLLVEWEHNVILIITPKDVKDPKCCPVQIAEMSAFPEEQEVLYPLGQQFQMVSRATSTMAALGERLGVTIPPDCPPAQEVLVLTVRAVDEFWAMAEDFFQDGGDVGEAYPLLMQRLEADIQCYGADHLKISVATTGVGRYYMVTGRYDEAQAMFQRALSIRIAALGETHADVAGSYNNIAVVCRTKGEFDMALEYNKKALAIEIAAYGDADRAVGATYNNMANVYNRMEDYEAALECQQKALAIQVNTLGESHRDVGTSYNNMALVYKSKGDHEAALSYYEKALAIQKGALGEDHPEVCVTYNNMALAYVAKGDYDRAVTYHQQALDSRITALGPNHPDVGTSYNNLAGVHRSNGQHEQALEYYRKALDIAVEAFGEIHSSVASIYNSMAVIYDQKLDFNKALESTRRALEISLQASGEYHTDVRVCYHNIALLYQAKGETAAAEEYFKKAAEVAIKRRQMRPSSGEQARPALKLGTTTPVSSSPRTDTLPLPTGSALSPSRIRDKLATGTSSHPDSPAHMPRRLLGNTTPVSVSPSSRATDSPAAARPPIPSLNLNLSSLKELDDKDDNRPSSRRERFMNLLHTRPRSARNAAPVSARSTAKSSEGEGGIHSLFGLRRGSSEPRITK